ncbi:hypothetical protein SteCoe_269 [Stentor coeruleus]|uniref:Uncharacterized protein n=1 Tax=Stentor coeruleus TaxID=5963 RepID=A0A1R2D4F3_9CILI|nr:hypothetical protein SteCoe_269 [Stentor coeruleus]
MKTVEELKQTLNTLKKALVTERDEKKEIAANLESTKARLRHIDEEIEKKVSNIQINQLNILTEKQQENDEELIKAKDRFKSLPKAKPVPQKQSGSARSIQALEQQNEKLKDEYLTLTRENKEDEEKAGKLKQDLEAFNKKLKKNDEELKDINNTYTSKNEEIMKKLDTIAEEYLETAKNITRASEKNTEIEDDLNRITRANKRMQQDVDNLKEFIKTKTELSNRLIESVKSHEAIELSLAKQLLKYKSDLLDANTFHQEFDVKVFSLMIKFKGVLILKKNNEGEYVIEIQYKGKCDTVFVKEVDDVYEHPLKDDRFVLCFKNKTKEIIAEEKLRIVTRIRELMQRCLGINSL